MCVSVFLFGTDEYFELNKVFTSFDCDKNIYVMTFHKEAPMLTGYICDLDTFFNKMVIEHLFRESNTIFQLTSVQ